MELVLLVLLLLLLLVGGDVLSVCVFVGGKSGVGVGVGGWGGRDSVQRWWE